MVVKPYNNDDDKQQLSADGSNQDASNCTEWSFILQTIISLIPRFALLTFTAAMYYQPTVSSTPLYDTYLLLELIIQ